MKSNLIVHNKTKFTCLTFLFGCTFLLVAYLPSLNAPFFSVDDQSLIQIPQLSPPPSWQSITSIFKIDSNIDYYPVRDLSYLIDACLWPGNPTGYRAQQLLWFLFASVCLYSILRQLGAHWRSAALFSAIWMIHPYHAETLMWISARKDIMALSWALASVYFFLKALSSPLRQPRLLSTALILFFLSLLSKSSCALLPFAGIFGALIGVKPLRQKKIYLFLVATGLLGLSWGLGQSWFYTNVNNMQNIMPWSDRWRSSMIGLSKMTGGIFIPAWNVIDHDHFGEWIELNPSHILLGLSLWVSAILTLIYGVWRKDQRILTFLAVVGSVYLPISGLLFPHKNFYSTRFFEPVFAVLFAFFSAPVKIRKNHAYLIVLLILFNGYFTWNEGQVWTSSVSVREKALAATPSSVSLKSYLLGDLINAIHSEASVPDKIKMITWAKSIQTDLSLQCTEPQQSLDIRASKFSNCSTFLRHQLYISKSRKNTLFASKYLKLLTEAQQLLRPTPKMVSRLKLEYILSQSDPDRTFLENWIQDNPYLPNPEYRLLKLSSSCILGKSSSLKSEFSGYVEKRLLTPELLRSFLAMDIHPELQKKIKNCLTSSEVSPNL